MLNFKYKKIILSFFLSVLTALLIPTQSHAESYETGDIAAKRAAEQRAAIAKRKEMRKLEAQAKKEEKTSQETTTDDQKSVPEAKETSSTH